MASDRDPTKIYLRKVFTNREISSQGIQRSACETLLRAKAEYASGKDLRALYYCRCLADWDGPHDLVGSANVSVVTINF
jgi:hypothetical protein